MRWWQKEPSREEVKTAARAATLKEPKRFWRGSFMASPFERFARPLWRRRIFTGAAWLAGWCCLAWALSDAIGPSAWKLGAGILMLACGGILPLWRVLYAGLVSFPPWEWFASEEGEK